MSSRASRWTGTDRLQLLRRASAAAPRCYPAGLRVAGLPDRRRAERARRAAPSVLSLVGGKWTTFRALGEHLANDVLAELGTKRQVSTAQLPSAAAPASRAPMPASNAGSGAHTAGRDAARAAGLLTRYGTRAEEVISYLRRPAADRAVHSTRELSSRELEFMASQRADRTPRGRPHPPHVAGLPGTGDRRTAERNC